MSELKGMAYLKNKLQVKKTRIDLRYDYYEMKNTVADLGISTPPQLRWMMGSLGWCGKAVDCLADRLSFREFGGGDVFDLNGIFNLNNKDILIDSAILGALITSCDFIYITNGADGPAMRVIDGGHATGEIDPVTNMLTEGYAVLESDSYDHPIVEAYLLPHRTEVYRLGKREQVMAHSAPYPLLVPVIYRPDAKRPFGHSRISRACMDIVKGAIRTVKRSEISAEFYSYPQRYVLGMDPEAQRLDKWQAAMSAMLRIDKDEDGDKPTVGQFSQQSQAPHLDQLRSQASLFAGETGLTLDDLGFPSQNPSSAEAIKASHETLRLTARKAQKTLGVGLLNAGYLAACLRDKQAYRRNELYSTTLQWDPIFEPDAAALGGIGDAVGKIQTAFPEYFTADKLRDLTGI